MSRCDAANEAARAIPLPGGQTELEVETHRPAGHPVSHATLVCRHSLDTICRKRCPIYDGSNLMMRVSSNAG